MKFLSDQLHLFGFVFKVCERKSWGFSSPGCSGVPADFPLCSTHFLRLAVRNSYFLPPTLARSCSLAALVELYSLHCEQVSVQSKAPWEAHANWWGPSYCGSVLLDICNANSNFHRLTDLLILYQGNGESLLGFLTPDALNWKPRISCRQRVGTVVWLTSLICLISGIIV